MGKVTKELSTALAKAIKRRREAKGMSQAKLAELSGLAQTFIGMIEKCQRTPTVDTANSIAKALGVSLSKLIVEAEKL
jgi:transcriptional regulator with XRE-family HTH domain